jgi:hypothetical protein
MTLDPSSIHQTARGFMESCVILTAVELDLFDLLASEGMTAGEVSSESGANLRGVTVLLDALASLGYLAKKGDIYRTEPALVPLLTKGSPDSILPGLMHAAHLWHGWAQLEEIVMKGGHAVFPAEGRERRRKAFIGAMSLHAAKDASQLVKAVKPGAARSLLDIGGATGGYTVAFLEAVPDMTATIFDLPPVIEMARKRLSESRYMERLTFAPGDFNRDELPAGHDLALLSAIIHMNSLEQNGTLFRKVYGALNQNGRIVIRDYVMEPDRTRPVSGALFAINMLVNTDGGGTYTLGEIRDGLEEAGFTDIGHIENRDGFSLVQGFKAESNI